jgi:hypothetical protein
MNLRTENSTICGEMTPTVRKRSKVNVASRPVHHANGVPAIFNVGDLPAKLLSVHRGSRAVRRRSVRFPMPVPWQFLLLDVPEVRRAFLFERRVVIVHTARALVESGCLSLNAAAKLLDVPASWLCVMLQKYRDGGDESLLPKFGTPGKTTACRISFFVRTK